MEKKPDKESKQHPGYLPYTQLAMGMIQPEWIFMTHLFEREEEEKDSSASAAISQAPPAEQHGIQINFRPRQSPSVRQPR